MKKTCRSIFSVFLALTFAFVLIFPVHAAEASQNVLKFNSEGKFTILQFADCQDDILPRQAMIKMMEKALDTSKPDLVVFTGDNIAGGSCKGIIQTSLAINAVLAPVVNRGIPFAVVFGNHDSESGVSKEDQLKIYQSYKGCLAYDAVPSLYGCANYNLPILSNDGSKDAFNLWFFDSNEYDKVNGGYDWVHDDQVQWYKDTSLALEQANGGPVYSLAFQHICAPETYELLREVPAGAENSTVYNGTNRALVLNELAKGHLGEWPCPSNHASGEFQAFVDRKDVLGLVSGHDHKNDFVGTYEGVDIIQTPGIGFQTYHDREVMGCRVFTLDEGHSNTYQTETHSFADYYGTGSDADFYYTIMGSELGSILPAFAKAVFAFLDFLPKLAGIY